jgi:hypothetical protein
MVIQIQLFDKKTKYFPRFDVCTINNTKYFVIEEFYTIKFADLIDAIPYCSINEAVAGYEY